MGWYTRPGCKVVTRHVTIGGSDKQQKEPLLLYPVFQRDICCLHQVLFVMPHVGSSYSRKVKDVEVTTELGGMFLGLG